MFFRKCQIPGSLFEIAKKIPEVAMKSLWAVVVGGLTSQACPHFHDKSCPILNLGIPNVIFEHF